MCFGAAIEAEEEQGSSPCDADQTAARPLVIVLFWGSTFDTAESRIDEASIAPDSEMY